MHQSQPPFALPSQCVCLDLVSLVLWYPAVPGQGEGERVSLPIASVVQGAQDAMWLCKRN